ncbi:MAG: hypothetical protein RIQ79_994, partial [Verrucomicrobiota bacterium]
MPGAVGAVAGELRPCAEWAAE